MAYRAELATEEVKKFCVDFLESDVARITKVEIFRGDRFDFIVVLIPEEANADLLDASLHNGLLSHLGWRKKFTKK